MLGKVVDSMEYIKYEDLEMRFIVSIKQKKGMKCCNRGWKRYCVFSIAE